MIFTDTRNTEARLSSRETQEEIGTEKSHVTRYSVTFVSKKDLAAPRFQTIIRKQRFHR
jgi:hypothetical protein